MQNRSNPIDSITTASSVIEHADWYCLMKCNSIVYSDCRVYIIDTAIKEYFEKEFSS